MQDDDDDDDDDSMILNNRELSQNIGSTGNRRNQKQEGAKIGTHSQEEPFLGGHKPKPGGLKIGRKKVGSTNYRKNINRRHRKRKK